MVVAGGACWSSLRQNLPGLALGCRRTARGGISGDLPWPQLRVDLVSLVGGLAVADGLAEMCVSYHGGATWGCSRGSLVGGIGGLDAVAPPVAGTVCRSGCVRSSFSPFPRVRRGAWLEGWVASMRSRHLSPARFAGPDSSAPLSPPFLGRGRVGTGLPAERLRVVPSVEGHRLVQSWGLCVGLGVVWLQGGGSGGGRRDVRGRSVRLRCGQANMAAWVAWLRVVGGVQVQRWGVSAGVHHLSSTLTGRR